jgi:hypothetical protein
MHLDFKIHRKRYRIQWALILFVIQIVLLVIFFFLLQENYKKWTGSSSMTEGSIYQKFTFSQRSSQTKQKKSSTKKVSAEIVNSLAYSLNNALDKKWTFAEMKTKSLFASGSDNSIVYTTNTSISVDIKKLYHYLLLRNSTAQLVLDAWLINYVLSSTTIEPILEELTFLIPDLTFNKQLVDADMASITYKINQSSKDGIVKILDYLQQDFDHYLDTTKNGNDLKSYFWFTATQAFQYVWNQLVLDPNEKYSKIISYAAQKFALDEDIIRSVIFAEQLRGLTTYRGIFKRLLVSNKYLMVMSQFSYWLWWIKEKVAMDVENWYTVYNLPLYQEIFAYTDQENVSNQRVVRLTRTDDYYHQIMYVAWALAMYRDQRLNDGYNISDKIWIITTLYNVWYKKPNSKPEIWWANIKLSGETFSFWRLSTALFYIIKSYKYTNYLDFN